MLIILKYIQKECPTNRSCSVYLEVTGLLCRSGNGISQKSSSEVRAYIDFLHVIDNQQSLFELSHRLEPRAWAAAAMSCRHQPDQSVKKVSPWFSNSQDLVGGRLRSSLTTGWNNLVEGQWWGRQHFNPVSRQTAPAAAAVIRWHIFKRSRSVPKVSQQPPSVADQRNFSSVDEPTRLRKITFC